MSNVEKEPIVVVGAGICGVSTALWLQRDGHDVILIDKAKPGQGASAMVIIDPSMKLSIS